MIASVTFRNFRALRNAHLSLAPFNLVIGPNGSGKTSLIQALLRLRLLAKLPLGESRPEVTGESEEGPELTFRFNEPYDGFEAVMGCKSDAQCDLLQIIPLPGGGGVEDWPTLRGRILRIRGYVFDHHAMAMAAPIKLGAELAANGGNLGVVIEGLRVHAPVAFAGLRDELCRILPEYADVVPQVSAAGLVELKVRLAGEETLVAAENLSQGTLYLLAILALAYDPEPPSVVCIEEIERGFHPRLLREVRDILYRLSHPESVGVVGRRAVQVIATTHAPYFLDLFRDHPEEIVISQKKGGAAQFSRLADRADIRELLASEGTLGDFWYAGILGGVPEEKNG